MARLSLSPGFRFHPTDVELVKFYLKRKVMGKKFSFEAISEVNIYKFFPWDLPDKSCLQSKDREWYFFCPRERKYASGSRANRSTENGYWKTTGKDRAVCYNKQTVGMVKTLVFHLGHAPKGDRTDWVMHEYRIEDKDLAEAGVAQDAYVLCKIFKKSGPGPNNGAQYGAPFNEEDWSDDEDDNLSPEALVLPDNQNDSVLTSTLLPGSICSMSLAEAGPSNAVSSEETPQSLPDDNDFSCSISLAEAGPSNAVPSEETPQSLPDDNDLSSLLAMFVEDGDLLSSENGNAKLSNINHDKSSETVPSLDGNAIFNCLGDLYNWSELDGGGFNFSSYHKTDCSPSSMPSFYDVAFLELNDLDRPLKCPAEAGGSESFRTDSLCGSYNYDELNSYQLDSFGSTMHISGFVQSSLPAEEFNWCGDHIDVFQKENNVGESANYATLYNVGFSPCKQPEEGSRHDVQDQERGRLRNLG